MPNNVMILRHSELKMARDAARARLSQMQTSRDVLRAHRLDFGKRRDADGAHHSQMQTSRDVLRAGRSDFGLARDALRARHSQLQRPHENGGAARFLSARSRAGDDFGALFRWATQNFEFRSGGNAKSRAPVATEAIFPSRSGRASAFEVEKRRLGRGQ